MKVSERFDAVLIQLYALMADLEKAIVEVPPSEHQSETPRLREGSIVRIKKDSTYVIEGFRGKVGYVVNVPDGGVDGIVRVAGASGHNADRRVSTEDAQYFRYDDVELVE